MPALGQGSPVPTSPDMSGGFSRSGTMRVTTHIVAIGEAAAAAAPKVAMLKAAIDDAAASSARLGDLQKQLGEAGGMTKFLGEIQGGLKLLEQIKDAPGGMAALARQAEDLLKGVDAAKIGLHEIKTVTDEVNPKLEATMGKFNALVAVAETMGSAVTDMGGQVVELNRLSGEGTIAMQGLSWEIYKVKKLMEDTVPVRTEFLDAVAILVEQKLPGAVLWLNHFVAEAAEGKISLVEMQKKIEDFINSTGVMQLSTSSGTFGSVLEFKRMFRDLMDEIKDANTTGKLLDLNAILGRLGVSMEAVATATGRATEAFGGVPGPRSTAPAANPNTFTWTIPNPTGNNP